MGQFVFETLGGVINVHPQEITDPLVHCDGLSGERFVEPQLELMRVLVWDAVLKPQGYPHQSALNRQVFDSRGVGTVGVRSPLKRGGGAVRIAVGDHSDAARAPDTTNALVVLPSDPTHKIKSDALPTHAGAVGQREKESSAGQL